MTPPILLVHGTWGQTDLWWRTGHGGLADALLAHGLALVNATEPFEWTGDIGGIPKIGPNDSTSPYDSKLREWVIEARHLVYYCHVHRPNEPVDVIAHSHGGQLAFFAIKYGGLIVRHLVTVSTPVRRDMQRVRRHVRAAIRGEWLHIHGDWTKDIWSHMGRLFDGELNFSIAMPEAHRNYHAAGRGHSNTLNDYYFSESGALACLKRAA